MRRPAVHVFSFPPVGDSRPIRNGATIGGLIVTVFCCIAFSLTPGSSTAASRLAVSGASQVTASWSSAGSGPKPTPCRSGSLVSRAGPLAIMATAMVFSGRGSRFPAKASPDSTVTFDAGRVSSGGHGPCPIRPGSCAAHCRAVRTAGGPYAVSGCCGQRLVMELPIHCSRRSTFRLSITRPSISCGGYCSPITVRQRAVFRPLMTETAADGRVRLS